MELVKVGLRFLSLADEERSPWDSPHPDSHPPRLSQQLSLAWEGEQRAGVGSVAERNLLRRKSWLYLLTKLRRVCVF